MQHFEQLHGLHVLTDRGRVAERRVPMSMEEIIERAIFGGATVIQLREKVLLDDQIIPIAFEIKRIIRGRAIFIINDRVGVAKEIDADGVHVGQGDMLAKKVRKFIGYDKILGVSASSVEEARKAIDDGADYLGVGPIFPTNTKLDAHKPIGIQGLSEIRRITPKSIPLIAIGGIKIHNAGSVAQHADGLAVITEVMIADDPAQSAIQLSAIIKSHRHQ